MHNDFYNLYITLRNEYLLRTEALFVSEKQEWFCAFASHFEFMCIEILKLQKESMLPAISHMEYTMLYTNFVNRKYVAEVWVYGDDWYCDSNQHMVGEYDISHLFFYYDELWNKLLSQRKRYVGAVTAQEVIALMLKTLPNFYSYFIKIVRAAATDCSFENPFNGIAINETFRVNVGDFMAKTEPVFVRRKNKDAEVLAKWFEERNEYEYSFEDYSAMDFSGRSFSYTNFRYSRFKDSILCNISLKGSWLDGVNFYKANMEKCSLYNCSIYEANFSYANLKNANLTFARGRAGMPDENEWRQVGFLPVSFRYANLTNADLRWADLTGADFTGAILDGAILDGAILDGAIFDGCIGKEG